MHRPIKHCAFTHNDHRCRDFQTRAGKGKQNQVLRAAFHLPLAHSLLAANYCPSRHPPCLLVQLASQTLIYRVPRLFPSKGTTFSGTKGQPVPCAADILIQARDTALTHDGPFAPRRVSPGAPPCISLVCTFSLQFLCCALPRRGGQARKGLFRACVN